MELIKYKESDITLSLKEQLDEIDSIVKDAAWNGYYWSRLNILMGMWEKGGVIARHLGGVNVELSWAELSKQTGRRDISLKK